MRVLILSCNTGGGHNAAAKAVGNELKRRGIDFAIKDALDFCPKFEKTIAEKGHSWAYKNIPVIYGKSYDVLDKGKSHYLIYLEFAKDSLELSKFITENDFDTAICVHEFPALMLTAARKLLKLNIKLYFVATDYTCSPGFEEIEADKYFIPSGLRDEFVSKGIPSDKIEESGIPVDSSFYGEEDKAKARIEMGLDPDTPLILIAAGSIGCGPISELAEYIKETYVGPLSVAVFCGNNKSLIEELKELSSKLGIIPIGFTDKVRTWLACADVYITKPGGLSTTEAASAGVPMVFMDVAPGLETRNLQFFIAHGCAVAASRKEEQYRAAMVLLTDKEEQNRIIENQRKMFSKNAVECLVDTVLADIKLNE